MKFFFGKLRKQQKISQTFIDDLLLAWMETATYNEERRYLEQHPVLASPNTCNIIKEMITATLQQQPILLARGMTSLDVQEVIEELLRQLRIIAYTCENNNKGNSKEVIQHAYINAMGGFMLALPQWLEALQAQIAEPSEQQRIVWTQALARSEQEELAAPIRAAIAIRLNNILAAIHTENHTFHIEQRIAALKYASAIYTRQDFPVQWAETQNNLGLAYRDRITGNQAENRETALAAFKAALEVYACDAFPMNWSNT